MPFRPNEMHRLECDLTHRLKSLKEFEQLVPYCLGQSAGWSAAHEQCISEIHALQVQ